MKNLRPPGVPVVKYAKQNDPAWLWQDASDAPQPQADRSVDQILADFAPPKPEEPKTSVLGSVARGGAQGLSLGFADEISGALESAVTNKSYKKARDESRAAYDKARTDNQAAYLGGELGGGLASMLIPGLNAAKGAKLATQVVKAGMQGGVSGLGSSEATDAEGIAKDAAVGVGLGAGLQGVLGGAIGKYVGAAERRAVTNTTKDLAEGAIPTFQRRFGSMKDLAFQELEPDKAFMKAAKTSPEKARDIAEAKLQDFGGQTMPIYGKLDKEAGKIALDEPVSFFNKRIAEVSKDYADGGRLSGALEEVRDALVDKAKANGTDELSHKDVRKWVTGLLKTSFKKIGTIAETENAWLASEAHEVADDFLKGHLKAVRSRVPSLNADLDQLTTLNKKIKAYASAESLMAHKEGRAFWKQDGLSSIADGKMNKLGAAGAVVSALATGNPMMLGLAAAPMAISAGASAVKSLDRKASAYLARLLMDAKAGKATAQQASEAIRAGVPKVLVNQALGGYRATLESE